MTKYICVCIGCFIIAAITPGCKKYLDVKSVQNLSIPETLDDQQQIMDNPQLNSGSLMENTATDEIYIDSSRWATIPEVYNKGYIWHPALNDYDDWQKLYAIVFNANTVLLGLDGIAANGQEQKWNNIKGEALFIRAHAFYKIAQLYATQYDAATAATDLGIPLRLNADFNETSVRSTVKETYDRIVGDLVQASSLLPANDVKNRPTQTAARGLLARVYLQMGDYQKARDAADQYLQITSALVDYNSLNGALSAPMGDFRSNVEVVYYFTALGLSGSQGTGKIVPALYNSFQANDKRKTVFFAKNPDGSYSFKGKYTGTSTLFAGIATDEMYLIRAECQARLGNTNSALQDLNLLLSKRYDASFVPLTASSPAEAVGIVLQERKKQLLARGLRWSDLKRLNKESPYAVTAQRTLGTKIYTLPANDNRYSLLIPFQVLNLVDLPQNPR